MEADLDEEEMVGARLYEKIECHWRMVFEDNTEEVDDKKTILHANRWYVYMNEKLLLIKCGYYVEVSCFDGKKVMLEVVYDGFQPKMSPTIAFSGMYRK